MHDGTPDAQLEMAGARSTAGAWRERAERLAAGLIFRREAAITSVAVGMFIFFSLRADYFLTSENVIDMARAMAFTAIVAVGMTYLFIAGELDLSAGSLYGFASVAMAWLVSNQGLGLWVAFALTLCLGIAVGLTNGFLSTVMGVPSFIVTLGMLSLLKGAGLWLSGSFPITLSDDLTSSFFGIAGGYVGSVPAQIFWLIGVVLVGAFVLRFTVFGYHVYATGGNEPAARQSGINTAHVKIACFVLTSFLVALIAALQVGWLRSAQPTTGTGFELQVIGAVIIGGTALFGGEGSVFGTLIGAAILTMLANGLLLLGFSTDSYTLFTGAVIIIAATVDVWLRRKDVPRSESIRRLLRRRSPSS